MDRSDSSTFVGAANFERGVAEFLPREPASAVVPDPVGPELCRLLRHDDIPLPALAVSAFRVATDDGLEGLPAGLGTGRGGVCAADIVGMEE